MGYSPWVTEETDTTWKLNNKWFQQQICFLTILETANLRSRCWQIGFFQSHSPWLTDSCFLTLSLHGLPSVCVCVQMSSSYKDTSQLGLGPTLVTSL